ncbi:MAG: hypothetical protein K2J54_00120, partial [Clostridia bacterium]|nr:hypothetical protein [Clostridia bacterium]
PIKSSAASDGYKRHLFESLFESVRTLDCDILGLRTMLYKNFNKKYGQYSESLIESAKMTCEVKLKSNA